MARPARWKWLLDEMYKPNGLCFSPDYKKLYIVDTGATHYPDAPRNIRVYDVADAAQPAQRARVREHQARAGRRHPRRCGRQHLGGLRLGGRGLRWRARLHTGRRAHRADPVAGTCANLCFGGTKRNRLFMAASQSLYALYVETRGAHFC